MQLWFQLTEEDKMKIKITTMSVAAVGALLNLLVIIAIVFDPLKRVRRGPWITILNLATADLITCMSAFCLRGTSFFNKSQSLLYYVIVDFCWSFGVSTSFLLVTFFTVQVFLLTKFPLKSRYWLTTLKITVVCIALWLFAGLLGFGNTVWFHFPGLVTLKIYIAQICVLQITVLIQIVLNILVTVEVIRSGRRTGNAQNAKHRNIAKTVILLSLVLYLTAFPYFVVKQIELFTRLGYIGKSQTAYTLYGLSYCYTPIAILNFGANPILYSLRLPDYRQTLLTFVGKKRKQSMGVKAKPVCSPCEDN
jgi:hypothetical protein